MCMYVCCAYVWPHMCVFTCICVYLYVCICAHVFAYLYICVYLCLCTCICGYLCFTCVYVYLYMCVSVCLCLFTCTHVLVCSVSTSYFTSHLAHKDDGAQAGANPEARILYGPDFTVSLSPFSPKYTPRNSESVTNGINSALSRLLLNPLPSSPS